MTHFFQRLLPAIFGNKAARPTAMPTPRTRAPSVAAVPDQVPAANAAMPCIGARRPLISTRGEIVGFEFRIGEDLLRRLSRRGDDTAKAAHARAVLASAQVLAQSGRIGLARLPPDCLAFASGPGNLTGLWIGVDRIDPEARMSAESMAITLQDLRARGAKITWDAQLQLPLTPDFVLLTQGRQSMADILQTLQSRPPTWQILPTLVTDIASFEDLELALHWQVNYVCGSLSATASASDAKEDIPLSPEVGRIGALLNQLVTGAENDVIVARIKSDVGLSYRLLQRINSASFARTNAGASIEQAVLLLGRAELYRWLSLLLFQYAGKRKISSALQEIALWRSRLLELLAQQNHEESPPQLFTLGLASMMGAILNIGLHDVIGILPLHPKAQQALVEHDGPWQVYLQLAQLLEAQDLEDDNPLISQFGGVAQLGALSDTAWAWAWSAMRNEPDGQP